METVHPPSASTVEDSHEIVDVVKQHIQNLKSNQASSVIDATFSLGCLGKNAETAIDTLVNLCKTKNAEIRANVIAAIGRINSHPELCIPVLKQALIDPDVRVRQFAAAAIGLYSPRLLIEYNAINSLHDALTDDDECVREFISETLTKFRP